ncbi:MAG: sodium:solute symporter family protein [Desulfobacterales bacterium]|nr:sodium:solute symporter family protein [Desulfobacterales bacterium]
MTDPTVFVTPTPFPFFLSIAIYFALIGYIGWRAARTTKTLSDFFVMSGKAGALVGGFAYFASQYSMSTFMGVPAVTYSTGFAGMSISVPGLAFSMIIPALFVGRKLMIMGKKYGFLTMTDYLSDRYESNTIRALHAVMMVGFLIAMMGAQTVGAGVVLKTFTGLPEWVGVVGMGIIVILYCMAGGMKGAMMTDVLQGFLMVTTAIVTFAVSVKVGGGLSEITSSLAKMNPDYLAHPGAKGNFPWATYMSMIVMWSFFTIGQPTLFTKFFTMKNYETLFKAVILGTLGMLLSATLIEWAGANAIVSIKGLAGKQTDFIVPMLLQSSLPPVLASVLIAGVVSAGMSTIDALLVVATGGVTRDIYQNLINPKASEAQIFKLSRWVTVAIGLCGIAIGIIKPATIFGLIRFAFGGLGIWVAPVILGIYWRRASKTGAMVSVIFGEVLYIAMKLKFKAWAFGFDPLIVCWFATMAVMISVSLLTPSASEKTIKRHFDNLVPLPQNKADIHSAA